MKKLCILIFLLSVSGMVFAVNPEGLTVKAGGDTLSRELNAVQITESGKKSIRSGFTGTDRLEAGQIRSLPVMLGESDVLRALRLLPGIQSVGEGNSGVYVRGGSAGHNLFLLDGMEILNPSHLMGLFSVFNPMTTGSLDVYKGNAPVYIQGKLASTIRVNSSFADAGHKELEANWGTISGSAAYRYSSRSGNFRFVGGYRRSYLETLGWIASAFTSGSKNYFKTNGYSFQDFNGLAEYTPGVGTIYRLAWYTGGDEFHFLNPNMGYNATSSWGNQAAMLSLDKVLTDQSSYHSSLSFQSTYSGLKGAMLENSLDFMSKIRRFSWKNRWDVQAGSHFLQGGINAFYQKSLPLKMTFGYNTDTTHRNESYTNLGMEAFLGDDWRFNGGKTTVYTGVRFSADAPVGPYQYGDVNLRKGAINRIWYNVSPVFSFSHAFNVRHSFKSSFSMNEQNVHLASLSSIPLPFDVWMSSSPRLKPETASQLTFGYYYHRNWFWSVEVYGKTMQHQLLFNAITDNTNSQGFEDQFFSGKGASYGLDFALERTWRQHSVHLRYSFARSFRLFEKVNNGDWFNDKNDRPHDFNIQWSYKTRGRWTFHALWTFASGCNMNLPLGRWWMSGLIMNDYDKYNGYRLPAYHRLDVSADWNLHSRWFKESVLNFSIVNVYNRANPYFAYYKVFMGNGYYDLSVKSYQISLFPIMPSISWRIKYRL